MKKLILDFIDKNKKLSIMIAVGFGLILLGLLSWNLVFVKYKDFAVNESKFIKAAKRYYEYHSQFLPKDNESREVTLQDLYDYNQIGDLYAPKSRKMCDVNSWVRVFKIDNEYKYYAYLKCGKYSSRVDHEGPVITLNGDDEITVPLNTEYKELGVKDVNDKKDGKMNIENVIIDSSKVNTKKIGTYDVTYTVIDSKYNKTIKVRKVTVTKGLTATIKGITSEDGFVKGNDKNNYILFSGMLWRAYKLNEDGTVRLILNSPVTNLRMNFTKYDKSNPDTWLNDVFYKALKKNGSTKYLVKSKYCVSPINSMMDYEGYCNEAVERNIGLLDINEYYKTSINGTSSIFSKSFALANMIGTNYADATFDDSMPAGVTNAVLAAIKPVITINDMSIMSGDGTIVKPYKLNDYSYGKKTEKINTRLIGEYLEYSGLKFRILGKDNDNVRLIMNEVLTVKPDDTPLYISTENLDKWEFNLKDDNNPAYIVNNDFLDYLNTKYILDTEYDIPLNDPQLKYNEYKTTKVKAKIVFPKTYELFAAIGNSRYMYTYIDKSTSDTSLFTVNSSNGRGFELDKTDFLSYSVKGIITIKGDLRIESGNGTVNDPYKMK